MPDGQGRRVSKEVGAVKVKNVICIVYVLCPSNPSSCPLYKLDGYLSLQIHPVASHHLLVFCLLKYPTSGTSSLSYFYESYLDNVWKNSECLEHIFQYKNIIRANLPYSIKTGISSKNLMVLWRRAQTPGLNKSGLESQLYHSSAVWPKMSFSSSPNLSFLDDKLRPQLIRRVDVRIRWDPSQMCLAHSLPLAPHQKESKRLDGKVGRVCKTTSDTHSCEWGWRQLCQFMKRGQGRLSFAGLTFRLSSGFRVPQPGGWLTLTLCTSNWCINKKPDG